MTHGSFRRAYVDRKRVGAGSRCYSFTVYRKLVKPGKCSAKVGRTCAQDLASILSRNCQLPGVPLHPQGVECWSFFLALILCICSNDTAKCRCHRILNAPRGRVWQIESDIKRSMLVTLVRLLRPLLVSTLLLSCLPRCANTASKQR